MTAITEEKFNKVNGGTVLATQKMDSSFMISRSETGFTG